MYVEFAGIPGAGKTTIVENTERILREHGIHCITKTSFFNPEKKRTHKLLWSLRHARYLDLPAVKLFLLLARRRGSGFEKTGTRMHEHQKLRYQLSHQKDSTVALWDGWFVQLFSNLVIEGLRSEEFIVEFIRRRLPPDTLLVLIDTPVEESVRRMREREARLRATRGIGMQQKNAAEEKKEMKSFIQIQSTQKSMIAALAKQCISTLVLDGTKPPEENAALVYKKIKEISPI